MASTEDPKGAPSPGGENSSAHHEPAQPASAVTAAPGETVPETTPPETKVSYAPVTDDSYNYSYDDPYSQESNSGGGALVSTEPAAAVPAPASGGSGSETPPPPPEEPADEDDGMLRMSFLEHLEELRSRLIRMLMGVGIVFVLSLTFAEKLWLVVQGPAEEALRTLGKKPELVYTSPMEAFQIVWVKLPILSAVFLASPWILYQVWAFIAPGLYKKERRWAVPFVVGSAGLFILGGVFAYFVAFRYALTFLLSIGSDVHIVPMVTISEYFDLFVNVMLGVGLVFEMPVLIFFLTLLRITSPAFLVSHSRYAILIIVIIAAIITPTPDVFNLMLFSTPMILLFYVGIFAGYLLVLSREGRRFPWLKVLRVAAVILLMIVGILYFAVTKYGYHFISHWPFLTR